MKLALSLLALIYFLLPYDFFPDFILGWGWIDDLVIFPRALQSDGYETAYIGKWHMGEDDDSARPGFDYWVSHKGQGNPMKVPTGKGHHRLPAVTSYVIPMMCYKSPERHHRKR